MNIILWIITGLTALVFLASGAMKLIQPKEKLAAQMKWVEDVTPSNIRLIGLLEVLGAIGLILPRLTGVMPWLSSLAAIGLILTMIGGAILHTRRKEPIVPNIVLSVLAAISLYAATQA